MCAGSNFCDCGEAQGARMVYPADVSFLGRFVGFEQREQDQLFIPLSGFAQIHAGDFREASFAGKVGIDTQFEARLAPQDFDSSPQARPLFHMQTEPIPAGSAPTTQSWVNAWASVRDNAPGWGGDTGSGSKVIG